MSLAASDSPLSALLSRHGARLLRYSGVSVFNVAFGQVNLLFFLAVVGLSAIVSNLLAVMIGILPAFYLNKRYVWKRTGPTSLRTEIVPFWALTLIGLLLSTLAVRATAAVTDIEVLISASALVAWGVVWVLKYAILDKFLFREPPAMAMPAAAEAPLGVDATP